MSLRGTNRHCEVRSNLHSSRIHKYNDFINGMLLFKGESTTDSRCFSTKDKRQTADKSVAQISRLGGYYFHKNLVSRASH